MHFAIGGVRCHFELYMDLDDWMVLLAPEDTDGMVPDAESIVRTRVCATPLSSFAVMDDPPAVWEPNRSRDTPLDLFDFGV